MKSKEIKFALLGLVMAAFLASGCVDSSKMQQLENEINQLNQVILQKDTQIKTLTYDAQQKQKDLAGIKEELDSSKKELDNVKKELDTTKKDLDSVSKKLDTLTAKPEALQK